MSYRKTFIALLCVLTLASIVMGQAPQAASTPAPTTPAPTAARQPALAVVNGQPITLADLDPNVAQLVNSLDARIAETRRNTLDAMINEILYEAEAGKRKITVDQLLDAEAFNRIPTPTAAQVQAVYDTNRDKLGDKSLEDARPEILTYLRSQSAQKLISELAARLRAANKVEPGAADVNAPNLAPSTVLATVAGRTLTAAALNEKARQAIYELRMEVYEAEMNALELKINDLLLTSEARRRNVTERDIINAAITDKAIPVTDADVDKFYAENKGRIKGDLASVRDDIRRYLEQQERRRLVGALAQQLRAGAQELRILLTEPEPNVQEVSLDDDPSRGNPKAPVTIVMFTDFQCPSCAMMHPVVEEALKSNGDRIRLVVRDYPLDAHANARKAAEAAGAANAQGKFFEYTALLYKNQTALDVPSLKKYASEVGLDRARFDRELDGGVYAAEVSRDIADAVKYGVKYTPTIFINGVRLRQVSAEGFQAELERAFARVNRTTGSAAKH